MTSPGSETLGSQSPRGQIPVESVYSNLKFEKLCEIVTKILNSLTFLSMAQVGSNDEKNLKLTISLDCPFNSLKCTYLAFFIIILI